MKSCQARQSNSFSDRSVTDRKIGCNTGKSGSIFLGTSWHLNVGGEGGGGVWARAALGAIRPNSVAPNAMPNFEVVIRMPMIVAPGLPSANSTIWQPVRV